MRYGEPQPFVGVGLHLGQGREPTGLCVVEVQDRVGTETAPAGHPTGKPRIVRWRAPGRSVTALGLAVQIEPGGWCVG